VGVFYGAYIFLPARKTDAIVETVLLKEIEMKNLWNEYDRLYDKLGELEPGSKEYNQVLDQILRLYTTLLQVRDDDTKLWEKLITNQAFVTGSFATLGTLMVISSERLHVITSRAFSWIRFK
jgi:hypothetical protein